METQVGLIISSPPYAETLKGDGTQAETAAESYAKRTDAQAGGPLGQSQRTQGYGSKGNLGNLKPGDVAAIISSPPYEGSLQSNDAEFYAKWCAQHGRDVTKPNYRGKIDGYHNAEGQLGNSQGDTFWSAAKIIVEQCYAILRPGGVAIFVVKDFVRNKARVDFCGDWRKLCEAVGFKTLHEHHALLVKETEHNTFFGPQTKRKERKSFFRRLAESKGSPKIDYETVLCMQKRLADAKGELI